MTIKADPTEFAGKRVAISGGAKVLGRSAGSSSSRPTSVLQKQQSAGGRCAWRERLLSP